MHTNKGDIKLKLYNDTPLHRDNFIKLVKEGQYNGLLFHRVIKDFMIQGGDVTSKDAPMNKQLGAGDLGYTVPAEFRYPKYFHKKGALCAARTGDEVNPEKASSASQFYIVTGKKYSEQELNQMEKQLEGRLKQEIFARLQNENKPKIMEFYRSGNKEELAILRDTLIGKTELEAAVLQRAQVFVEYEPQTRIEGELQQMPADFAVTEFWRVLQGQAAGRTAAQQITVFDSVGFALEDYSALRCMHALARSAGLLAQIELIPTLDDPKDLFAMVRQAQATHTALHADRKAA